MPPEIFQSEIINYIHLLPSLCAAYTPSYFWERHVKEFDEKIKARHVIETLEEIWELTKSFPQEPPVCFGQKFSRQNIFLMRCLYCLHRNGIYTLSQERIENIAAVFYLRKRGRFEAYEAIRKKIGAKSTMTLARHFYYSELLLGHVRKVFGSVKSLSVLEIGGGGGMFARILYEQGLVGTYYDVDLPEILLSASLTLSQSVSGGTFRFGGKIFSEKNAEGEAGFNFYPAQYFDEIPRNHFDIILNIASFQEMDNAVRDRYIKSAGILARRPTIFMNINRKQDLPQRDGTTILTNPLQYPYDAGEEILEWGADQMQDSIRANSGNTLYCITPKSFPIVRVSLIK